MGHRVTRRIGSGFSSPADLDLMLALSLISSLLRSGSSHTETGPFPVLPHRLLEASAPAPPGRFLLAEQYPWEAEGRALSCLPQARLPECKSLEMQSGRIVVRDRPVHVARLSSGNPGVALVTRGPLVQTCSSPQETETTLLQRVCWATDTNPETGLRASSRNPKPGPGGPEGRKPQGQQRQEGNEAGEGG